MGHRVLAVLLVLSWMILSGVDILEDLAFESRITSAAASYPSTAQPIKLANDNVELANRTSVSVEKFFVPRDLMTPNLTLIDPDSRVLRSHKDNCVFLI